MEKGFFSKEEIKKLENIQFCSEHECTTRDLKALKDEKKFWHRLLGSRWSYIIIPAILVIIFGWIGRVERVIQAKEVEKEKIVTICKDVQEIKIDNKMRDEKRELEKKEEERRREEDRKERDRRDRETMKILLDIQKQIRK